jgi:hypothetical protein
MNMSMMNRRSAVAYGVLVAGDPSRPGGGVGSSNVRGGLAQTLWPMTSAMPLNQVAVPSSEPSTTTDSPDSSRWSSAAQTPPASVMPDMPSPWPTMPVGHRAPVTSIADWASEPRPHQVIPS